MTDGNEPDRDEALRALLGEQGVAPSVIEVALQLAAERRAAGEQVGLLQALISMGLLDLATAQAIQAEAPPPEGVEEPLRAPSGRAEPAAAVELPAEPDLADPFNESGRHTALPAAPDLDDPFNESGRQVAAPATEAEGAEETEPAAPTEALVEIPPPDAEAPAGVGPLVPALVGLIAVGGVVLALLLGSSSDPGPEPTTAAAPSPTAAAPPADLAELERRLAPLEQAEDLSGAAALIESAPGAVREAGGSALAARLARLQRGAAWAERLRALAAAKRASVELKTLVLKIENQEVARELRGLRATAAFLRAAREILGDGDYDDLVALGIVEEDDDPERAARPRPTVAEPRDPVRRRRAVDWLVGGASDGPLGNEERRKRFAARAVEAEARVAAAREALAAADARRQQRVAAEFARAKRDPRPLAVPAHRGLPAGKGELLHYGERQFVLRMEDGRPRTFTWADAPASTACDLLERALDPRRAEDQLRLGFRALRGSLFDRARVAFRKAKQLDPKLETPDLKPYRRLARVFQASGTVDEARLDLRYGFDTGEETDDFDAPFGTRLRLANGALVIATWIPLGKQSVAFAAHQGKFARGLTLELERLPGKGRLLISLNADRVQLVLGPEGAGIGSLTEAPDLPLKGRLEPRRPIRIGLLRVDDQQTRLVVKQGARHLLDQLLTQSVSWPYQLVLGATDGDARLARLRLTGAPDAEWLRETRDQIPFRLEQALLGWERQRTEEDARPSLPEDYEPTSAEDALCLEGISQEARDLVKKARHTIARQGPSAGSDLLRQALLRGRGRYWAVEYLLAAVEVAEASHAESLEGALLRVNRAIAGVEDFYEALALRSTVHLHQGRLGAARADAEAALKLRADYAPARLALAYAALQAGDLERAVAEARLAAHLSKRRETQVQLSRLRALRDGPSWNTRVVETSPRFRLQTDLLERGKELLAVVEQARRDAPTVFPVLKARPGAVVRRADVFVFANKEDYHRHAWRTGGDRKEHAVGFFGPLSGQLLIYDSKQEVSGGMLRVLRHETTHQWVHSLGLALPYWVNEALADYMGGYDAQTAKSTPDLPELKALLEHARPPHDLYDLMTFSPSEFYSGNSFLKYAQAWSFVHYCMEGGDPALKKTFFAYLAAHTEGDVSDKSRQLGVRLAHLYASTFHQLDMKQVAQRWWAYVLKLGRAAGLKPKEAK